MSEELQFHPYANLFPLIEGAEFDALVEDIKANGLRNRIVIFDGKILDGRNRYRAAKAAGIKLCGICNEDGKPVAPSWSTHFIDLVYAAESDGRKQTQDDALRFVLSENLHRRHLTDAQRAAVAADIANLGEGRPKETSPIGGVSQADAAKMLNTSKRAVERAVKRKKEDPAAHEAAKAGKVERKPRPKREWKPKEPMCKMGAEQSARIRRSGVSIKMNNFLNQETDKISAAKIAIEKLQEFLSKFEAQPAAKQAEADKAASTPEPAESGEAMFSYVVGELVDYVKGIRKIDRGVWGAIQMAIDKVASRHQEVFGEPAYWAKGYKDDQDEPEPQPEHATDATSKLAPTICTDPERLKKLEQWRRKHSKSVYGTAGGAK